jgi:hypothetical protein
MPHGYSAQLAALQVRSYLFLVLSLSITVRYICTSHLPLRAGLLGHLQKVYFTRDQTKRRCGVYFNSGKLHLTKDRARNGFQDGSRHHGRCNLCTIILHDHLLEEKQMWVAQCLYGEVRIMQTFRFYTLPKATFEPLRQVSFRIVSLFPNSYHLSQQFCMSWVLSKSLWHWSSEWVVIIKWPLSAQTSVRNKLRTFSVVKPSSH